MPPKDADCAELGRRFRAARERAGKALRPFAAELGCSYYVIRRHEAGNTMLRTNDLLRAARLLSVPPETLFQLEKPN